MDSILIAMDFSKFSEEVERRGFDLATRLKASVTLIAVIVPIPDYARPDTGVVFTDNPEERVQAARADLEKIKEAHPGVPTNIICIIGDPKSAIVETAIQQHSACVMVGTHGRTGLSHLLLGSVAEYVVRHSPIPVMVVPYRTDIH